MLSWENSHVEFSTLDSVIKVMRASEYIFVFESPIVLTLPPSPPLWIWSIYVIWYTYLLSIYSQFFQRKFSFSTYIVFPASHLVIKRGCFFWRHCIGKSSKNRKNLHFAYCEIYEDSSSHFPSWHFQKIWFTATDM